MVGADERVVIEPRRMPGEPALAGPGLLLLNPADLRQAAALVKEAGWRRRRLFQADLWQAGTAGPWLAGPAVGAPQAVLCLEKLLALGGNPVIALGWAGALQTPAGDQQPEIGFYGEQQPGGSRPAPVPQPDLQVGDLLLPTSALSEEGTSAHYGCSPSCSVVTQQPHPDMEPSGDRARLEGGADLKSVPDCEVSGGKISSPVRLIDLAAARATAPAPGLLSSLTSYLKGQGLTARQGPVWTTDAPYRETVAKVRRYRRAGILAVEMEYAALAAVARFRRRDFAALLLISDLVGENRPWQPVFDHKDFRRRLRRLLELLLCYLEEK